MKKGFWIILVVIFMGCEEGKAPRQTSLLRNWEVKEVLTSEYFLMGTETHYVDEWVGYRVGTTAVYRTLDGGRKYTPVFEEFTSSNPPAIFALDVNQVWFAGTRLDEEKEQVIGQIYRSSNGGESWDLFERENTFFRQISFISSTVGFAYAIEFTGDGDEFYRIYRTSDGGATWEIETQLDLSRINLFQILWKDSELGFILGRHGVHYRTRDAGDTWERLTIPDASVENYLYPVNAEDFFRTDFLESYRGNWASGNSEKQDEPVYVLTQSGEDVIGVLFQKDCEPFTTCDHFLVSSSDGGRSWEKHLGLPIDFYFDRSNEIKPGLVVVREPNSANVYFIQRKGSHD
ncbi:WD40/YVTN/BNR-like repeat-containing protein [Algoriphagus namhaensis]